MLLKNFYIALASHVFLQDDTAKMSKNIFGTNIATSSSYCEDNLCIGTTSNASYCPSLYTANTYSGVVFGTGTAPVTFDDYTLSGTEITSYTYSRTVTKSVDELGMSITGLYTITNTSNESFTIGEVGLRCTYNGSSGSSNIIMIERTVLESPVTIPAGGVGQVTYTIRMNYPTA